MILKPPKGAMLNRGHPYARVLKGHWLMNEGGGTIVNDLSGNGNTGALVADAHFVAGKFGPAVSLDGTDDYVACGDRAGLSVTGTQASVSIWIYHSTGFSGRIFDQAATQSLSKFQIYWHGGANIIYCDVRNSVPAVGTALEWCPSGEWVHVVGVYNGTDVRLYINGVLGTTWGPAALTGSLYPGHYGTAIGAYLATGGAPSNFWNGAVDCVTVYNYALSPVDAMNLYRSSFCVFEVDL